MIWTSLIAQGKRRLLMSFLISILVFFLYVHLARFYQGRLEPWILALGWILVGLNLLRAGLGLAYRLDRHPFRRFDLGLRDDRARPGSCFELELVTEARRAATLRKLAAGLECIQERDAGGVRKKTRLYHQEIRLVEGLALEPGETRRFELALPVPEGAPFSYRDFQGRIRWLISIRAEVADWGELEDGFEVTVVPG